ncbi:MAG: VgrG-related protein [Solirubrobacteraceae bacterium]
MSPAPAPTLVAGVDVKVAGQPLDPSILDRLLEARVQDNLMLPDAFMLRLRDPDFQLVDGSLFEVGAKIELKFAGADGGAPGESFSGEVATIAPQFEGEGCVLVVRGYDVSHKLNRSRRTRTFQDMTASDIAAKIIGEAGLAKVVEPTRDVYPFEQQSNETDWDFLWRLAARVSYELACADGKIHFRAPGAAAGAAVKLEWGQDLRAFHPRATAVAQVEKVTVSGWDPKAKRRVSADAQTAKLDSKIGLDRDKVAKGLGGGTIGVPDQIVTSQGEADALAQSTLDRLANAWLEAEGVCRGNPKVRAGSKVEIAGVGTRFGGEYLVTKSTHSMRGEKGYETHFEISGRNRRTLVDLLTPRRRDERLSQLVVGIVTNNDDPEKMGRVRVKFPWLDERQEGWWARVASPSASGKRGIMMMPLVDDEVVVGFEHGDPRRPFVLGSLWNGPGKPDALAAKGGGKPDGSFNLRSDKQVSIASGADMAISSEAKLDAKATGDTTLQTDGKLAITGKGAEISITGAAGSVVIKADGSITIKGSRITVDASAQLTLQSSGVVSVKGSQVMLG